MENKESLLIGVTLLAAAATFTAIAVIGKRHKSSVLRELGDALDDDDQATEDSYNFITPTGYHENEFYQLARKAAWDAGFIDRERIKEILRLLTARPPEGGSGRGPTPEDVTRALLDNSLVLTQHGLPVVNPSTRTRIEEPQTEESQIRSARVEAQIYDIAKLRWTICMNERLPNYLLYNINDDDFGLRIRGMIIIPKSSIDLTLSSPVTVETLAYVIVDFEGDTCQLLSIGSRDRVTRLKATLIHHFMRWECNEHRRPSR